MRGQRAIVLDVSALLLLSGWLVFVNLGQPNLGEPDEPRSALIARVMAERGDWLAPHLPILGHHEHPAQPIDGDLRAYLYKPPLFFWLEALAMKVFGSTAFAARLPAALSQIASVLMVYAMGRSLSGRAAGLLAAGFMAMAPLPLLLGRLARLEATLTACLTAMLLALLRLESGATRRWAWAFLLCAAGGLVAMTKGPAILFFPVAAMAVVVILGRRWGDLRRLHLVGGAGICLAVAAPWYLYMHARYPSSPDGRVAGFLQEFFVRQSWERVTTEGLGHIHRPGYLFLVAVVGFLPWSAFLPGLCVRLAGRAWRERREAPALLLLFAWVVAVLGLSSVSKTQLEHYAAPAFPALALLAGIHVAERLRVGACSLSLRVELIALAVIVAAAPTTLAAMLIREGLWRTYWLPMAAISAVSLAAVILGLRGRRTSLALSGAGFVLCASLVMATDPFRVLETRSTRTEAMFFLESIRPGDQAIIYPSIPFSFAWTIWPRPIPYADSLGQLADALDLPNRTVVFSRDGDVLARLKPRLRWPVDVLLESRKGIVFATCPEGGPPPEQR